MRTGGTQPDAPPRLSWGLAKSAPPLGRPGGGQDDLGRGLGDQARPQGAQVGQRHGGRVVETARESAVLPGLLSIPMALFPTAGGVWTFQWDGSTDSGAGAPLATHLAASSLVCRNQPR